MDDRKIIRVEAGVVDIARIEGTEMTGEELLTVIDGRMDWDLNIMIPGSKRYKFESNHYYYEVHCSDKIIGTYQRFETDKEMNSRLERSAKAKIAAAKTKVTKAAKAEIKKKAVIKDAIKVLEKEGLWVPHISHIEVNNK